MAASAKRKQEEKHLKMLREMTSLAPNRKCFDCDQRGPTYANMTVGSFVCTSCSGILRGLNPPHRVKSISMTTFTQQEVEFLQKHGNESCKQIWLGLYDDRTSSIPDFREPQKVKEFLQDKYEKKRWFVPPEQAKVVASVHASISGSSASSTSSTPEVRPLKTLLGESAPALHLNKNTPSQSPVISSRASLQLSQQQYFHDKKFDLLSDLGGDIFAAPSASQNTAASTANFANFAHFNSHPGGSVPGGVPGSLPPASSAGLRHPQSQLTGVSAADRYAALAELDTVFGSSIPATSVYSTVSTSQGGMFGPVTGVTSAQPQQCISSMPQGFGGPSTNPFVSAAVAPSAATTNPFQSNGRAAAAAAAAGLLGCLQLQGNPPAHFATFGPGSLSMPAGLGNAAVYKLPTSFSGTFQQPFPGQAPFPQPPAYPQQPNGGGFSAYGQAKAVVTPFGQAGPPPGASSNPFLTGAPSGHFPAGSSSTNPFL
ncbi:arf-GAP domain and FG repeat-containing protein 1a isoform X5 [Esox lucius]|uniref:arf-GAP domain and FG repeat-containing protein 1a isoform X5 n=1 Tax=Esox lucius TaxID=8010 RepID=UPI0010BCFC2C|nr:arf-GAP domain and FG repeat-containing protein 1a isoform X5 [Esox lucius]